MPRDKAPEVLQEAARAYAIGAPEVIEQLFREEVLRARVMPPEEKLLAGERLFNWACQITLAGIRAQFPDLTEPEVQDMLARRLALKRKLDNSG